ncbi:hypothetical protein M3223_03265 [Paenibacillus pasadenensis]|uniref:hypothetical protein n=1 Tax=Paenibacillus pasadenensis TaxID=217090 RepID=UPI00203AC9BF|nr:hypothetical protein [Paenibacillus pasadenensis]MCM3746367.1 hypothetical protein [Paenibacillus pasadenensis]
MDNLLQTLLNFVLSNIVVVFVILGAVGSLIGKLFQNQGQGQKPKPPGRMPDFGGGGMPVFPSRPSASPLERQPASRQGQTGPIGRPAVRPMHSDAEAEGTGGDEGRSSEWQEYTDDSERYEQNSSSEGRSSEWSDSAPDNRGFGGRNAPGEDAEGQWHSQPRDSRTSPFGHVHSEAARPAVAAASTVGSRSTMDKLGASMSHPDENGLGAARRLTGEDLRQAVLWAEILGPPRSRKHGRR